MKITALEKKKNKLIIEIAGETHTLLNVIKDELWNDSNVKVSGYNIEHPLTSEPKLIVQTTSVDALDAVKDAVKRVKKNFDQLQKKISSL